MDKEQSKGKYSAGPRQGRGPHVGLVAWCGSGIVHADDNHEQEACALMDDRDPLGVRGIDCAVRAQGAYHRDATSRCGARWHTSSFASATGPHYRSGRSFSP
jgi:hypothetical protein